MIPVLDFHNHIFPEKIATRVIDSLQKEKGFHPYGTGTVSGLKEEMRISGVRTCLTLAVATSPSLVESTNRWILDQKTEGFIPIGSIHPFFENYEMEVKRLKKEGVRGVKFHSLFQDFHPDDERVFPLYQEIIEQGMFMIFHSGPGLISTPEEEVLAAPERIGRLLRTFPKAPMIIAHFGGFHMTEEAKKHLLGKEVYIDTSYPPGLCFQPKDWVLDLIHRHDPDRILFGTDTPFARQKEDVEYLLSLPLSDDLKEKILWKNGMKLLGMGKE
jgi:predicted TIM-barrel fold metal-dependent hydrolase